MKRDIEHKLIKWKAQRNRKPLILQGARQVGKTWSLNKFGEDEFQNTVYINFDNNLEAKRIFDNGNNAMQFKTLIELYSGQTINPASTLLILDEIQECPKAITSLKYFCEQMPQLCIAAAGSLLGLTIHEGTGFPVGKVDMLSLYPLSFLEFLDACGNEQLRTLIEEADFNAIEVFADRLENLLKQYYFVGGMPEAVNNFALSNNYESVRTVQQNILNAYRLDATKHLASSDTEHILAVWDSIPAHLSKENKKFVFRNIATGARARDYKSGITWLNQAKITHSINRVSKPGVPLSAYKDASAFKLFLNDVGLLGAMAGLDKKTLIEGNSIFTEFKGSLTEQNVCQQIFSQFNITPYYWSANNSKGEIDFLVQDKGEIYAIEVKAQQNLKSKSLAAFNKRYSNIHSVRLSLANYKSQGWVKNVPLYAISSMLDG